MKCVLITGADGFIGRHLVNKMLAEKIDVYGIVLPGHNIFDYNEHLHIVEANANELMDYLNFFPIGTIDSMYHFAWAGVNAELRNNVEIQLENIEITLNCIRFAVKIGVKKIIFPGSTNEYLYYGKPINKDAVPSPNNAYGSVKVALRYLCKAYTTEKKVDFVYAILGSIYAADRCDNNVIYYTIDKLLKGEKPLLTKLEQLWDYVYIDDVVEALFLIGKKGINGAVYSIGHGDNWCLSNYINIIHEKIDPLLPLGIGVIPYSSNDLPSSCIDLTDIYNDTGFKPQVKFEDGISKVIEQMKEDIENERK